MKKLCIALILSVAFLLNGCSSEANELTDKKLSVFTVIQIGNTLDDLSTNSAYLIFDFNKNNKVSIQYLGESYPGSYKLNGTNLSIDVLDKDKNEVSLLFTDFKKHPKNEKLYTGIFSDFTHLENHGLNILLRNYSGNEYMGFYEVE
ncbi:MULTISPECIES: hypothetical protein [unclassified Nosocomiicoccus]|uniref:hypothetical protein n=1 Tax=unclassified Nosocomiicoccus TaxID=2646683 RepID=UPI0008A3A456|nr:MULTISPECIES: hypothetical protein [unclassified Nosocomiicoccus]OFL47286.1 hypothetical protein HMPREF2767_03790 [Nosocomiicoccus sp. HMSC067E10]OFO56362.1 hypothetical protein HMPREF3029_00395 [Nosocomiicoccus sp. HMSC059G07]